MVMSTQLVSTSLPGILSASGFSSSTSSGEHSAAVKKFEIVRAAASSPHTLLLICGLPDFIKQSDFSTAAHQWISRAILLVYQVNSFVSTRQETIRLQCMRAVHWAQVLWGPPNQLAFSAFHPCSRGGSHHANDLKVLFSSV